MSKEIDYKKQPMTVGFLVTKDNKVLLVEKGRNLGAGKLVGVGGKQEEGETLEETQIRETREEIKVKVLELEKVAELSFDFPHNPKYGGLVIGYLIPEWKGKPKISKEALSINWFDFDNLPKEKMWHDNTIWLPLVLEGKKVRGRFTIGEDDRVKEGYSLEIIESF